MSASPQGPRRTSPRGARSEPFHCPYCGDEDLRPNDEGHGTWECRACLRVFRLSMVGQLRPPADVGGGR